ncbi:pantoate--beta-alanine ligase [Pedobacter sp. HMF7647]|uniref:Pantothenate synthetase n=1 Tax=Hufsiella arboris TaxID=2695275 RepID=A0A7K1Y6D4_9SPHI|nr:pantoate--beta-alanine ligase [Hufsiella arboris]MXV50000.1 pantoate--beta-alanine ligase [Hufsiella arboris]
MKIFKTKAEVENYLMPLSQSKTVGFVPTMGALHNGHLSLIRLARQQSDISVCSIFVNPTQFNDPKDLELYPRPVEKDIALLESEGCDVLFMPDVKEMYPDEDEAWHIELGDLENILEGKFRPGHYQGVTQIVKKLFDAVKPDFAFFGQKDYQQVKVVQRMVEIFQMPVKIIMCPIEREMTGLAMSSRNVRLSADEREKALVLYKSLSNTKDHFTAETIEQLEEEGRELINGTDDVKLEYFEICDGGSLERVKTKEPASLVALVAAWVGKTRLIDNLILK